MSSEQLSAKASIRIRKSAADVFHGFADAEAMSKFWFTRYDDGLKKGESSTWYLGTSEDAFSFDIQVKELIPPHRIVIEWGDAEGNFTRVVWTIEEIGPGDTLLTIEESGFSGSDEQIIASALNSTGGFNQVIVAAKALIEHGVALNVVEAHP